MKRFRLTLMIWVFSALEWLLRPAGWLHQTVSNAAVAAWNDRVHFDDGVTEAECPYYNPVPD